MAIKTPLRPEVIAPRGGISADSFKNFISGNQPLGSSVFNTAANNIVSFQRGAKVAPQASDLGSIIQTLSSNILTNVEGRMQTINQNVNQVVNNTIKKMDEDYEKKIETIDFNAPNKLLSQFLGLYNNAIGYLQFFAKKDNVTQLGDNLDALRKVFAETFDVVKTVRQQIIRIVDQLNSLPAASSGGSGLNLDVRVPSASLRKNVGGSLPNIAKRGLPIAAAAVGGAGASAVVSGLMNVGDQNQEVQGQQMQGADGLSGPIMDKFSTILDKFDAAIQNLISGGSQKGAAAAAGGYYAQPMMQGGGGSGGGGGGAGGITVTNTGSPEQQALLKSLRYAEGTSRSYGTIFGGNVVNELAQGKLTVQEVINLADTGRLPARLGGGVAPGYSPGSKATGAYQFMPGTLEGLINSGKLNPKELFTPEVQDRAALQLAANRGVTEQVLKSQGLSAQVVNKLAPEWASLPTSRGGSYYRGQSSKSLSEVQSIYNQSLRSAPTASQQPQQNIVTPQQIQPSPVPSVNARQVSRTVAQPPPMQQNPVVNVMPLNMAQPQQSRPKVISPTPSPSLANSIPMMGSTNTDNFLVLYSKMVYNIVDA